MGLAVASAPHVDTIAMGSTNASPANKSIFKWSGDSWNFSLPQVAAVGAGGAVFGGAMGAFVGSMHSYPPAMKNVGIGLLIGAGIGGVLTAGTAAVTGPIVNFQRKSVAKSKAYSKANRPPPQTDKPAKQAPSKHSNKPSTKPGNPAGSDGGFPSRPMLSFMTGVAGMGIGAMFGGAFGQGKAAVPGAIVGGMIGAIAGAVAGD